MAQRAQDSKEALQKQLHAAKASGSSGGCSDKSVLSLMMEVEDLKSKVSAGDVREIYYTGA